MARRNLESPQHRGQELLSDWILTHECCRSVDYHFSLYTVRGLYKAHDDFIFENRNSKTDNVSSCVSRLDLCQSARSHTRSDVLFCEELYLNVNLEEGEFLPLPHERYCARIKRQMSPLAKPIFEIRERWWLCFDQAGCEFAKLSCHIPHSVNDSAVVEYDCVRSFWRIDTYFLNTITLKLDRNFLHADPTPNRGLVKVC